MLSEENTIKKSTINFYLSELSKEIKREFGRNVRLEIIIVGGASILINYSFRDSTMDIDAYIRQAPDISSARMCKDSDWKYVSIADPNPAPRLAAASLESSGSSIKDAIRRVADKYNLSDQWINSDFRKTSSYSPNLIQYSRFYRNFNQVLSVRTIDAEYLIAMKLVSYRPYKHDESDIVGILNDCKQSGNPLTLERIQQAVIDLYGKWDYISGRAQKFIEDAIYTEKNYDMIAKEEVSNKVLLQQFETEYEKVLKSSNLESILEKLKSDSKKQQ